MLKWWIENSMSPSHKTHDHHFIPYKTFDHRWVLISHAPDDMGKKISICMRNSKNRPLDIRVVDLMKMNEWWIEDLMKISHTTTIKSPHTIIVGCRFHMHLMAWEKNFHLYAKFQKTSPEHSSGGLGENEWMMSRGLDENEACFACFAITWSTLLVRIHLKYWVLMIKWHIYAYKWSISSQ